MDGRRLERGDEDGRNLEREESEKKLEKVYMDWKENGKWKIEDERRPEGEKAIKWEAWMKER